jgi:hypothetical protein
MKSTIKRTNAMTSHDYEKEIESSQTPDVSLMTPALREKLELMTRNTLRILHGGSRPGSGRKTKEQKEDRKGYCAISVNLTLKEKQLIAAQSKKAGVSMSSYFRKLAHL